MLDSNWSYFSAASYMTWFIAHGIIRCLLFDPRFDPIYKCLFVTPHILYVGSCCAHICACLLSVCLPGTDVWEENGHILGKKKLACSRHSDSGERCEVKKDIKSRGGTGERGAVPLSPLPLPRFYFFALLFNSHRSPLSGRLEQARKKNPTKQEILLIIRGKKPRVCRDIILKQMARPQ